MVNILLFPADLPLFKLIWLFSQVPLLISFKSQTFQGKNGKLLWTIYIKACNTKKTTLYWRNSIFDTVIYFSVNYNRYLRKNKLSEINVAQVCNLANYFDINNLQGVLQETLAFVCWYAGSWYHCSDAFCTDASLQYCFFFKSNSIQTQTASL